MNRRTFLASLGAVRLVHRARLAATADAHSESLMLDAFLDVLALLFGFCCVMAGLIVAAGLFRIFLWVIS